MTNVPEFITKKKKKGNTSMKQVRSIKGSQLLKL